jgi:hypothetical protein
VVSESFDDDSILVSAEVPDDTDRTLAGYRTG